MTLGHVLGATRCATPRCGQVVKWLVRGMTGKSMYKVQINAQVEWWVGQQFQALNRLCYETKRFLQKTPLLYCSAILGTIQWDNLVLGERSSRGSNC